MPTEFKFPDVGEGITECEIVRWLVKEGDIVKADQNIVQIETDKAVVDLPAPVSGKILEIKFKEGDTIKVGQVLVVIGDAGEKTREKIKEEIPKKGLGVVGELEEAPEEGTAREELPGLIETEKKPHSETMKGFSATEKVLATPAIRKLSRDLKIDLSKIEGSGPEGRIIKKDLEQIKS